MITHDKIRQQQIDDEILARAIATQIEMVAESEMNGWELLRLFQLANAAKRELRRMYHKSIKQNDDLFRGYSMALDDIGKIGEASGLNPSLYMTHSPRQVAGMVLRKAQENTKRIAELELELRAADKLQKQQVEAARKLTDRYDEAIRYLVHCAAVLPVGLLKTKVDAFLEAHA